MSRPILITGGSIAGNTAAWWLGRSGFEVTVIERAPAFRDGGQNIAARISTCVDQGARTRARGAAAHGARAGGAGSWHRRGSTAWVDADDRIAARFLTADFDGDGMTAELEILRGDLARLLYEPAATRATWRFGDSVTAIRQTDDAAFVTFASGATARYDAVIVAEGVGSTTRKRVFPNENAARWMDLTIACCTISRTPDDDRPWRWYDATAGRSVSLRPDRYGTTRGFAAYEQAMRSMVDDAQGVPKIVPRAMNPHSRTGIRCLHAALHIASRPAVRGVARGMFGGRSKAPDLTRFPISLAMRTSRWPTPLISRVIARDRPGGLGSRRRRRTDDYR